MRRLLGVIVVFGMFSGAASTAGTASAPPVTAAAKESPRAVAVTQIRMMPGGVRDEAAMVLIGTALIGLAAAVRRRAPEGCISKRSGCLRRMSATQPSASRVSTGHRS